jgi:hypothetical protein
MIENKEKFLELIRTVTDWVKGNEGNIPSRLEEISYDDTKTGERVRYEGKHKVYNFTISVKDSGIKIIGSISKIKGFFRNTYVMPLNIQESKTWGATLGHYIFDSKRNKFLRPYLRTLFESLEKKEVEFVTRETDDKLNGFISGIQKSVNKTYSRDNKINDLLQ